VLILLPATTGGIAKSLEMYCEVAGSAPPDFLPSLGALLITATIAGVAKVRPCALHKPRGRWQAQALAHRPRPASAAVAAASCPVASTPAARPPRLPGTALASVPHGWLRMAVRGSISNHGSPHLKALSPPTPHPPPHTTAPPPHTHRSRWPRRR
jgi:hypothetical protein